MSGNPLDRLRAPGERPKPRVSTQGVAPSWAGPCLRLTGDAIPASLIFRERSGVLTALSYSYLISVRFDPDGTLDIDFVGHAVRVDGHRLKAVFEAVAAHRAMELVVSTTDFDEGGDDAVISSIAIVPTQER